MKSAFIVFILSTGLLSFRSSETSYCGRGLKGHVFWISGNQMPSPEEPPSPPKGMKTTLYIYELTHISQVVQKDQSPFYSSILTQLVKTVETNDKGRFRVKLKPGTYSLFVKKDDLFFSGQRDEKNNIHPVEVTTGMTEVIFNVNYSAAY